MFAIEVTRISPVCMEGSGDPFLKDWSEQFPLLMGEKFHQENLSKFLTFICHFPGDFFLCEICGPVFGWRSCSVLLLQTESVVHSLSLLFSVSEGSLCWVNRGFKVWTQSDDNNAAASVSAPVPVFVRSCLGLWFWRWGQVLVSHFPNPSDLGWLYSDRVLGLGQISSLLWFC